MSRERASCTGWKQIFALRALTFGRNLPGTRTSGPRGKAAKKSAGG
jgi:hypothetical protein